MKSFLIRGVPNALLNDGWWLTVSPHRSGGTALLRPGDNASESNTSDSGGQVGPVSDGTPPTPAGARLRPAPRGARMGLS